MTPAAALEHLITALAGQLSTNPSPITFWMPTAGERAGSVVWGNPYERSAYRPGDDPADLEGRELLMGWTEFVRLNRQGLAPHDINAKIQARAEGFRTRYSL
ncbi:hypothetical protein [Streptomyces sp. NPDC055107]